MLTVNGIEHLAEEDADIVQLIRDVRVCLRCALLVDNDIRALNSEALNLFVAEHVDYVRVIELLLRLRGRQHHVDDSHQDDNYQHIKAYVPGSVSLWFQKNFTSFGLAEMLSDIRAN